MGEAFSVLSPVGTPGGTRAGTVACYNSVETDRQRLIKIKNLIRIEAGDDKIPLF